MLSRKHLRFTAVATAILLATAFLRLPALYDLPPGLARDETLNADIVSFILEGRHALFFREGYGHEPLYHYLGAPFRLLLGDNVLAIRLPSVYLGLLLVAGLMRWARREFGASAALFSGALLAVSWWPIIFSRVGLRPILEPVLLVAAFWFWRRRPWLAGLFLALAVYSYTAARVIFLVPALYLLYLFLFRRRLQPERADYRGALEILLVSGLLCLPLWQTLRVDPSLQQRVQQLSGPLDALWAGDVGPILETTLATLGVFSFTGDPLWSYTLPERPFFDPLTAIFFYGGLVLAVWRLPRRPIYGLVLIWLGVTLLPSAAAPDAPSFVRLIGAQPVVYLLPALAVDWLGHWAVRLPADGRWRRAALALVPVVILLLNLGRTVNEGLDQWATAPDTRQKYQSIWLDISRHWRDDPAGALVVADSWYEPVKADSLRRDYGQALPARWVQQGSALILPGENGRLYVPEFAPPAYELLAAAGLTGEPLYRSPSSPSFAVYELPAALPAFPMIEPVLFDNLVRLLGYRRLPDDGRQVQLLTYWQVEAFLPWDLSTFVHLRSADGELIGQHDGLDAAPVTLQPGDTFLQRHVIDLPGERPDSPFTLQLGLYTRQDGRRLLQPGEPADYLVIED